MNASTKMPELRSLDQMLSLFDAGEFQHDLLQDFQDLLVGLKDHQLEFGGKPKGNITLTVSFEMQRSGDVDMAATKTVAPPKKPPASAAAFVTPDGYLTLHSPLLSRMHGGVRDVADEETEIRTPGAASGTDD